MSSSSKDPAPLRDTSARLESWKEIAAYLRRDVRTVQRWEHSKGLPVRRLPGGDQARVYALTAELDAWWNSRGIHLIPEGEALEPVVKPRTRRGLIASLIALATVVAGVLIFAAIRSKTSTPLSFKTRDWILITDFDNQTGDPIFNKSLLTAFTVGLEQSRYANVLPRTAIGAALKRMNRPAETRIDEQVGREICIREHVKGLVQCIITKTGREFALAARLVDPGTGVAVRAYLEPASNQDQIIPALGKLTARIRRDLGESLASIGLDKHPLPLVTTPSLEALKLYSEGSDLWRSGAYPEAVKAWEAALDHDEGFAMAHAELGGAYMSHVFDQRAKGKEHYEKALQNVSRVTERERLRIQGAYQEHLGHVDDAARIYRLYLAAFPDDVDFRFSLGTLLMLNRRDEEAGREFRQVVAADPRRAQAWIGLATSHRELNRISESLEDYAKAFALQPGWVSLANLNHEYGFTIVMAGDLAKARDVFRLMLDKEDLDYRGLRSLALLDMYEGKYRDSEVKLRRAAALTEPQPLVFARNELYLATLLEGRQDRAGQVRELDRAAKSLALWSDASFWLRARIGAAYARAGAVAKAEAVLRDLASHADADDSASIAELRVLEGEIAFAKGNFADAIGRFQISAESVPYLLSLASLARVYTKTGETEEAADCYRKIINMRGRALGWEPQQDWLEAQVNLAGIYAGRDQLTLAAETLRAIVGLWKDADRELPLKKRLARLMQQVPLT